MIYDTLEASSLYRALGNRIAAAFDFLNNTYLSDLPNGRIDLDGDALYALVQRYTTKSQDQGVWEAHHRYIDLQYIASGHEAIKVAHISQMQQGDYNEEKDFQSLEGSGQDLILFPSSFVILFPQDAHMPGLNADAPEQILKVVLKIRID